MIPRFRPGSMTIANSGLPAPNDRRVTMRTEEDHHLSVTNLVQLNVFATQATPQPVDIVATVESVVDLKTWTFLISSATTGWSNSQGNNGVYQFPLARQPLTRSGTINSRSSTYQLGSTDADLDQSPVNADTVFNYFLPEYKFPGLLASAGITTPEFQLTAETACGSPNELPRQRGLQSRDHQRVQQFQQREQLPYPWTILLGLPATRARILVWAPPRTPDSRGRITRTSRC